MAGPSATAGTGLGATLSPSGRWLALRTRTGSARVSLGIFDLQE